MAELSKAAQALVDEPWEDTERRLVEEMVAMAQHLDDCGDCSLAAPVEDWCPQGLVQSRRTYLMGLVAAKKRDGDPDGALRPLEALLGLVRGKR